MTPALSVVIPAFNEQRVIAATLHAVAGGATARPLEIVVVDDGSTDATARELRAAAGVIQAHGVDVRVLSHATNQGKGAAVRRGMLAARGALRLMCDADLSTPIEQLERLTPWINAGFDVVIGPRAIPVSRLDPPQPPLRRALALLFRSARRRMLLPHIRDTQCGFKLFTAAAAGETFSRATLDGWAFDCEVLAIAGHLGLRVREVGVLWRAGPRSHVRPLRDGLRALRDVMRIRRRWRAPGPR